MIRKTSDNIKPMVQQVKSLIHTSMQSLFGICNGAHHLDILRFDEDQDGSIRLIMRCPSEALELLLQTLPTVSVYNDQRWQFTVHQVSPLFSMIQYS